MKTESSEYRKLVEKYRIKPAKSLGQNFLTDRNIAEKIVESAQLTREDLVIEVGPGTGSLTTLLVEQAGQVVAVEIDGKLIALLEERFCKEDNLDIIQKDILRTGISEEILSRYPGYRTYKVVTNLPYYITTPILLQFIHHSQPPSLMVVMMQTEVADRILAKPGTKEYGSLTIAIRCFYRPERVLHVGPSCFFPSPGVTSTVLRLVQEPGPAVDAESRDMFFRTVRAAFSQRRKQAANAVSQFMGLPKEKVALMLASMGLDPRIRGEQMTIQEFRALSALLSEALESVS